MGLQDKYQNLYFNEKSNEQEESVKKKIDEKDDSITSNPRFFKQEENKNTSKEIQISEEELNNPNQQQQPPTELDASGEKEIQQLAEDKFAENYSPSHLRGSQVQQTSDPGNWSAEYTQQGFIEKTGTSLVRGFGKHVIGGTGDIVQLFNPIFGMSIAEGNQLSRYLQEVGQEYEEEYKVFLPPEIRDPKFDMKTFMNPDFWSGHIAEYIPQLIEFILLSKGAGALAKGGAKIAARKAGLGLGKKYVKAHGRKLGQNITAQMAKGAEKSAIELAGQGGRGVTRQFLTTAGEATKNFAQASEIVGGGLSMNILAGMQNAGQLINQYKDTKGPDGEPLYTEEELRAMASGTITNNFQYLPIDMLSWGITFSKGTGLLNRTANRLAGKQLGQVKKFFTKTEQMSFAKKSFQNVLTPTMSMLKRVSAKVGKPLFEGFEETFQETFEEWSQKRAFADATGQEFKYSRNLGGYMDYYFSPENEATRAISFALGGLGGAGASIMQNINGEADRNYKLWSRSENIKHRAAIGDTEAEMMQSWHVTNQLIDNMVSDDDINNEAWIDTMVQEGILSEEQAVEKKALVLELAEDFDKAKSLGMNHNGQVKFLQETKRKAHFKTAINDNKESLASTIETIKSSEASPEIQDKKILEAQEDFIDLENAFENEIELAQKNINNLLIGEKADPSRTQFLKDENGKTIVLGLTEEQYEDFYNLSNEAIYEKIKKQQGVEKTPKQKKTLKEKLFGITEKVKGKVFGEKKGKEEGEEGTNKSPEAKFEAYTEETIKNASQEIQDEYNAVKGDDNKALKLNEINLRLQTEFDELQKTKEAEEQKRKETEEGDNASTNTNKKKSKNSNKIQEPDTTKIKNKLAQLSSNREFKNASKNTISNFYNKTIKKVRTLLEGLKFKTGNKADAKAGIMQMLQTTEEPFFKELIDALGEEGAVEFLYEQAKYINDTNPEYKEDVEEDVKPKEETEEQKKKNDEKVKQLTDLEKMQRDMAKKLNATQSQQRARFYDEGFSEEEYKHALIQKRKGNKVLPDYTTEEENSLVKDEMDQFLTSVMGKVTYGPTALDKAMHLNQHYKVMFPGKNIKVYAMSNIAESLGGKKFDVLGYALMGTILIDEKVWNQEGLYMHEFGHVYYAASKNEEFTKGIVDNIILKNKPLLEKMKEAYLGQMVYYQKGNDGKFILDNNGDKMEFYAESFGKEFFKLETNGDIVVAPDSKQHIILEEAFVETLKGPLSENFNRYFQPINEERRQFRVRKWWREWKRKGITKGKTQSELLKSLNNGENVSFTEVQPYILKNFKEAIRNSDFSVEGRYFSEKTKEDNEIIKEFNIAKTARKQFVTSVLSKSKSISSIDERGIQTKLVDETISTIDEENTQDKYEDRVADDVSFDWKKSYKKNEFKAGQLIKYFIDGINIQAENNKAEDEKAEEKRRAEGGTVDESNIIDVTANSATNETIFKTSITNLAKQIDSPYEFIRLLEESKDPLHQEFLKYLKETYPDYDYVILKSMHFLYTNTFTPTAIIHTLDDNGNYTAIDVFSNNEQRMFESLSLKMEKQGDRLLIEDAINSDNPQDIADLIIASSNSFINTESILSDGYLIVDFEALPIKLALEKIVEMTKDNSRPFLPTDKNLESNFDPLIKVLLNTSRQHSSLSTVTDPKGNLKGLKQTSNEMSHFLEDIRSDFENDISLEDFLEKYKYKLKKFDKQKKTAKPTTVTSPLLAKWWSDYNTNKKLPIITMDLGTDNNGTTRTYNESTAEQLILNDTLSFMNSSDAGNYFGSMDTFGDSKRKFMLNLPVHENPFTANGKTFKKGGEATLRNLYNIYYNSMLDPSQTPEKFDEIIKNLETFNEFKEGMVEAMNEWVSYINDNADHLKNFGEFKTIIQDNKLTTNGKKVIENFIYNRVANSFYLNEMFNPGVPMESVIKRNKGNIAPVMRLNKDLRVEMLMWYDETISYDPETGNVIDEDGGVMSNDGGQYVLEEDALEMRAMGEGVINFNNGFKLFSSSTERKNAKFLGQKVQMKGYTTILTKESVTTGVNQKLKPMYDMLVSRKAKFLEDYKKRNGVDYNPDLATKGEKYLAIVTPISAEKANLFTYEQLELLKKFATLENLDSTNPNNRIESYNKLMDMFYYRGKEQNFSGLDGSNLGPQQVMDKSYDYATFGIQITSSILANASGQDLESALDIQEFLRLQKQINLEENVLKYLDYANPSSLTKFILKTANSNDTNPLDIISLENGALPFSPLISTSFTNQIKRQFIRYGNRLSVPGTYGQTVSDVGYKFTDKLGNERFINGNSGLKGYGLDSEGNTSQMEVILNKSSETNGTRGRKSLFNNDSEIDDTRQSAITEVTKLKEEFGLETKEEIEAFVDEHVITKDQKGEEIAGYYIPGETVMMTRIPHNGPAFMGVAEVAGFFDNDASTIMVPAKYKKLIGADDDGDAMFVYRKGKNKSKRVPFGKSDASANKAFEFAKKVNGEIEYNSDGSHTVVHGIEDHTNWNKALKEMIKVWKSPRMAPFLNVPLDFENDTKQTIQNIQEKLGIEPKFKMPFGLSSFKENYNNSIIAQNTLGLAFNSHKVINSLAAFETQLISKFNTQYGSGPKAGISITLNGNTKNKFQDFGEGVTSRIHLSTVIANIVLDSTKNKHADALNLNINTIGPAMILTNLGFDLETIGLLFNHPAAISFINKLNDMGNDYLETGTRGQILRELKIDNKLLDIYSTSSFDLNLNKIGNKNYTSEAQNAEIVRLMDYLFNVNMDISQISKILSGHKDIETNPHALEEQMIQMGQLQDNKKKRATLLFTENFIDNQEIDANLSTMEKFTEAMKFMSPVFNDSVKTVLSNIYNQITGVEITDKQLKHFSEMITPAIYARYIGINNIEESELQHIMSSNGVLLELEEYTSAMAENIFIEDPYDFMNYESELTRSHLFKNAIFFDGQNIVIHPDFLPNMQEKNLDQVRKEFGELPPSLQKGLVVYDLIKHGWDPSNGKSYSAIFSQEIQDRIDQGALSFYKNDEISDSVTQAIYDAVLNLELGLDVNTKKSNFTKIYLNNQEDINFNPELIAKSLFMNNRTLAKQIASDKPFYIEVLSVNKDGKINFFEEEHLKPTSQQYADITDGVESVPLYAPVFNDRTKAIRRFKVNPISKSDKEIIRKQNNQSRKGKTLNHAFGELAATRLKSLITEARPTPLKINNESKGELVAIPDGNINDFTEFTQKEAPEFAPVNKKTKENYQRKRRGDNKKKSSNELNPRGRFYNDSFENFTSEKELSEQQYHDAMQYKNTVSQDRKDVLFFKYQQAKIQANRDSKFLSTKDVSELSDNKLLELYEFYGKKDIYAYSIVLTPILLEIVNRASNEQIAMAKKNGFTIGEDGKDIGVLQSYLQANNISQNHPATQAIQRHIEVEFKGFVNEKKKYTRKIKKASEALYKERLGINPSNNRFIRTVKRAYVGLFQNRQTVYQKLYGNIITEKNQIVDGEPMKGFKLKSKTEIQNLYDNKSISKAEYDFAEVFRETVGELRPNLKDFDNGGFVPAVAMSRLEAFAHRGFLGMLANSKGEEHALQDVRLNYQGEEMSFKNIEDIFRMDNDNNFKNIKDYLLLKNKAKKLLKKGLNEDGSRLEQSRISNLTLAGDGMVDKFTNNGFVREDQMLSMDLDKALNDFVHTTLFIHGSPVINGKQNFKGFTKLQSEVDGLLMHNRIKGYDNQAKYVRKVYKEYFLKGKRLKPKGTTDKVVDTLIRGNMLYIMGWKLAVVGKGLYVIGNIVVGKYHNVKNDGGMAWVNGEKRFWGLNFKGPFGTKKATKVLENLNFMNISLYDEVDMDKGTGLDSFVTDLALMPMRYSESWIQEVQFLGLLTEEQWNLFDDNGNYKEGATQLTNEEIAKIENKVKTSQGKGYTATDQRLIQQYSWGRAMMQFSRFIPTMFYDRFSKKEVNIYAEEHIGSLRAVYDIVYRITSGEIEPQNIKAYVNSLSPAMQDKVKSGLRGLAITSLAAFVGSTFNVDTANELTGDANYLVNSDKLEFKMMPSMVRTIYNAVSSLFT